MEKGFRDDPRFLPSGRNVLQEFRLLAGDRKPGESNRSGGRVELHELSNADPVEFAHVRAIVTSGVPRNQGDDAEENEEEAVRRDDAGPD